jgi:uncharacterized membrane protein YeaQ/YmgE (transglycosylase-associated protein family)
MGIFVWFALGALIGLGVGRAMAGEFPGGRSGAAAAGAMGAFLAGALFASVAGHDPKEFRASTLPAAACGGTLLVFLFGRIPHPDVRPESRRRRGERRG